MATIRPAPSWSVVDRLTVTRAIVRELEILRSQSHQLGPLEGALDLSGSCRIEVNSQRLRVALNVIHQLGNE
jgi:hypothetical protein